MLSIESILLLFYGLFTFRSVSVKRRAAVIVSEQTRRNRSAGGKKAAAVRKARARSPRLTPQARLEASMAGALDAIGTAPVITTMDDILARVRAGIAAGPTSEAAR